MSPDQSIAAYLITLILPPACFAIVLAFFVLVRRLKHIGMWLSIND